VSTSTVPGSVSGYVGSVVDDAAVFPPGNASLADAVTRHRGFRGTPVEEILGPLLVRAGDIHALRELVLPDDDLAVGLVADQGLASLEAARDAVIDDPWIRVVQTEIRLPLTREDAESTAGLPELLTHRLVAELSFTSPTYIEIPTELSASHTADVLAVLGADGAERAKLRCGGTKPGDVPSDDVVARFIHGCVAHAVPFKLTAGLHHGLRTVDPTTGDLQHGFLNMLAATAAATLGASMDDVQAAVAARDDGPLHEILSTAEPTRVRHAFMSFGSCSVLEPYEDMVALRLVEAV
jgi:hypothetical protein